MAVLPSAWKSVPLLMPLTRKWLTSPPSVGCRSATIRPVWVSSIVVMSATTGVSPTGVTVMVEVATADCAATLVPSSDDCTPKLPSAVTFESGVKVSPACAWT